MNTPATPVMNTPATSVMNTPAGRLRIRIAPQIFEKIRNPFQGMSNGNGRSCSMKKTRVKNLVTLFLQPVAVPETVHVNFLIYINQKRPTQLNKDNY